jgi:hypothetical protein
MDGEAVVGRDVEDACVRRLEFQDKSDYDLLGVYFG